MRLYLTGFMGAGKTTVGRQLARRLEARFVDLDRQIERLADASVEEIFERRGEAAFRRLERRALEETGALERAVVATGGGAVESPENRALLRRLGTTVWLAPELETMLARLAASPSPVRPLFRDRRQAAELYQRRLPGYRAGDLTVAVATGEAPERVAERIEQRLREARCAI